jgi:hypothetical protein
MEDVIVKKKRGRKPKVESAEAMTQVDKKTKGLAIERGGERGESSLGEPKQKPGKRGRKAKSANAISINVPNTREGLCNSDDENIIINLKVRTNEKDENVDQSGFPNAYDAMNSYESTPFQFCNIDGVEQQDVSIGDNKDFHNHEHSKNEGKDKNTKDEATPRVVELLKEFEMKNKSAEWPQNTSISCYWCCHKFSTVPYGLPVKYYNEKFYVFGCFCSLECVAAYNFNSKEKSDEMWERYNLINLLSRKLGYKPVVKQAPPREALTMFGGKLSIEEYRQYFESNKILTLNFPPMLTITQQIEEINDCDVNSEYRYIPFDTERLDKYKEKLLLKRSKPLTNFKHTLDHLMNLKIASEVQTH